MNSYHFKKISGAMFLKLLLVFLFTTTLYSFELSKNYFVTTKEINTSLLIPNTQNDLTLFKIPEGRHSLRVKSKHLIKILKEYCFVDATSKYPYIQFTKKSPIDTTYIEDEIAKKYKQKYKNIDILHVEVSPRGYIEKLPKSYEVFLRKRDILKNENIFYIKTDDKKKIFFNYKIDAYIDSFETTADIKRKERLSLLNVKKVHVKLQNFKALPILEFKENSFEARYNIKKGKILTQKDISPLTLVKRGETINVSFQEDNIEIFFSAKALKNGKLNDTIPVKTANKKKLHVKITGEKRATLK